jgi:hypothetical protein
VRYEVPLFDTRYNRDLARGLNEGATAGMRSLSDRFYVLEDVRVAPRAESVFEEFLALIER